MNKKLLYKFLSVLFALILWQLVAIIVNADFLLASPVSVIKRLSELVFSNSFLSTVLFSFLRISGGFLSAFLIGIVFAVISGRFKLFEYLLWPFVVTVKSVPIASFIILCLIWLSFGQLTVFIAFLIVFPVVYSNVLQGIKSASKNLVEVANLYNIPFKRRLIYIYIPSIKPFLVSASNVGIGMAWKAGVAAEVIGVIDGSIGGKLYDAKIYLLNSDLLAWTVVIIALSVISEKIFSMLLKIIFERIEKI